MPFSYIRRAAIALVLLAAAGCTVKNTDAPPLTGPSELALTLNVNAIPDSISQDGGSQSSIKVMAIGPDGKPQSGVPLRVDMKVRTTSPAPCSDQAPCFVSQDFGSLSARSIVTGSDGVASVVYTAPPGPVDGTFGICANLPGNCVSIVATPTSTNFVNANPQQVLIRLVPTGVILPPAASPTAAFTFSPSPAAVGLLLHFDASSSKIGTGATAITTYTWDFGDGTSGTGKTPTHTFDTAASFNVTLTVTNDRNLSSSTQQSIPVAAAPVVVGTLPTAVFTVSPAAPGVGDTVFFNASTSTPGAAHTISSYAWTFGDGTTGTGVTTTHAFTTAGSYAVQLKVTDDDGQSTTSSATTVAVGSPPSPNANFTFSPATPGRNDQVVFDASSSTTSQGQTITDVAWNFGDGTAVIHCPGGAAADCPGPTNRISAHTFTTAQTFVVNLVVTDTAGRTNSKNVSVTVALADPNVIISASPTSPNPNQTVNFDSSATTYFPGSGPGTYAWSFGDGGTSTLANPTHSYTATGTYTVNLSLTDNKGRTGTATTSVNVVSAAPPANPVAAFTFSPSNPHTPPVTVSFDASGSSTPSGSAITNYRWNFGDGTIISGAPGTAAPGGGTMLAPQHSFTSQSSFTVTLTVTDGNGKTGSTTNTVTVGP